MLSTPRPGVRSVRLTRNARRRASCGMWLGVKNSARSEVRWLAGLCGGIRRKIGVPTGYAPGTDARNASTTSGRHHRAHFRISATTSLIGIAAR